MTRKRLQARQDGSPSWSSWLAIAALVVALLALLGPGFNGLSLLAATLAILSVVRRAIEYHRRTPAAQPKGPTHE